MTATIQAATTLRRCAIVQRAMLTIYALAFMSRKFASDAGIHAPPGKVNTHCKISFYERSLVSSGT
jgi:hypothetical protein